MLLRGRPCSILSIWRLVACRVSYGSGPKRLDSLLIENAAEDIGGVADRFTPARTNEDVIPTMTGYIM